MSTNTYYEIRATIHGDEEILFGSFDRSDCVSTLDWERKTWKTDGYRQFKIVAKQTTALPDPETYGNWAISPKQTIAGIEFGKGELSRAMSEGKTYIAKGRMLYALSFANGKVSARSFYVERGALPLVARGRFLLLTATEASKLAKINFCTAQP